MAASEHNNKFTCNCFLSRNNNKFTVYKQKAETLLNDKDVPLEEKVPVLVLLWNRFYKSVTSQTAEPERQFTFAQKHTVNLVLHERWVKERPELKKVLLEAIQRSLSLLKPGEITTNLCKKLVELVESPWGNPTLVAILNDPAGANNNITQEIEFFSSERGYLIAMRLKKLCDAKCEDLALGLAKAWYRCIRASPPLHHCTTEDQRRFIFDIYIALLHKFNYTNVCISELKALDLNQGLELVRRFNRKHVELSRIWRDCLKVAEFASQLYIAAAMYKPAKDTGPVLTDLLGVWGQLMEKLDALELLPSTLRRLIQNAESARHIYICCQVLKNLFGDRIKSFTVELFVRALTTDMNELEKQKTQGNEESVKETSERLAAGFLALADLLPFGASRECVLTSFSLSPTGTCFERLEILAKECDRLKAENDDSIKYSLLPRKEDSNSPRTSEVLSTPSQVLDAEALGLSTQLCDDLAVVLSSPRHHDLTWSLNWPELRTACEKHLVDYQNESRCVVKELKYLNIDYSQFKDWPVEPKSNDIYLGIQKGYEEWVEFSSDGSATESDPDSLSEYDSRSVGVKRDSSHSRRKRRRKLLKRAYRSAGSGSETERVSDVDTASQDSRSDSLGSDGLHTTSGRSKQRRNPKNSLPHLAMLVSHHQRQRQQQRQQPHTPADVVSRLLNHLDKKYTPPFLQGASGQQSDPKVLQRLRMYRPEGKKPLKDPKLDGTLENLENASAFLHNNNNIASKGDLNPRVLLQRIDPETYESKRRKVEEVLANVPGMNSLEMVQPAIVDQVVQVVQLNNKQIDHTPGVSKAMQNTVTSTPVTAHIQRVGQPRPTDKIQIIKTTPGNASQTATDAGTSTTSPSEAAAPIPITVAQVKAAVATPTLVNILSQQIAKPIVVNNNNNNNAATSGQRSSTFINILSHQIIKPATNAAVSAPQTMPQSLPLTVPLPVPQSPTHSLLQSPSRSSVSQSPSQSSVSQSPSRSSVSQSPSRSSITESPSRSSVSSQSSQSSASQSITSSTVPPDRPESPADFVPGMLKKAGIKAHALSHPLLKGVNIISTGDTNRLVQFVCQTDDGKTIQIGTFGMAKAVQVQPTEQKTEESSASPATTTAAATHCYQENYNKFIQNDGSRTPQPQKENATSPEKPATGEQLSSVLPKFQQAFGKTVYQSSDTTNTVTTSSPTVKTETTDSVTTTNTTTAAPKIATAGGVIYRQVPVCLASQTISLVPGISQTATGARGQFFRITTPESLNLNRDPVVRNKVSALLAAAIQQSRGVTVRQPLNQKIVLATTSRPVQNVTTATLPNAAAANNNSENLISMSSSVSSSVSSTTLEQLREFDLVLEQVKERSTGVPPIQPETKTATVATVVSTTPVKDGETGAAFKTVYMNPNSAKVSSTPLVVVTSYCSPAPVYTVTCQNSSSTSNSPSTTVSTAKVVAKPSIPKSSKIKSSTKAVIPHTSKSSPLPKTQQKPQEDEQTMQRIFDILAEYAEQLRNSPDLNNKPAPRRRSNPPTNPSQSSKRKKSSSKKSSSSTQSYASTSELSPSTDDLRTIGSEDSSCGIVQISVQDSPLDDHISAESSDGIAESSPQYAAATPAPPTRQIILSPEVNQQQPQSTPQPVTQTVTRNVLVAEPADPTKLGTATTVLVPGNYIVPVSMVKSGQPIAVVSGGSKILATVPSRGGQNMLLLQSFLNQARKTNVIAHQPTTQSVILTQPAKGDGTVGGGSPTATVLTLPVQAAEQKDDAGQSQPVVEHTGPQSFTLNFYPKTVAVINKSPLVKQSTVKLERDETILTETTDADDTKATVKQNAVIDKNTLTVAQALTELDQQQQQQPPFKEEEFRTKKSPTTSGPMLISTIRATSDAQKKITATQRSEGGSQSSGQTAVSSSLQRKAAIEKELRLQKSLSEECEDLGVGEPSTSDLFPEADLLFDSNHSPSFDQLSQNLDKHFVASTFHIESTNSNDSEGVATSSSSTATTTTPRVNNKSATAAKQVTVINKAHHSGGEVSVRQDRIKESDDEDQRDVKRKPPIGIFSDEENSNSTFQLFQSLDYETYDNIPNGGPNAKQSVALVDDDADLNMDAANAGVTAAGDDGSISLPEPSSVTKKYKYKYTGKRQPSRSVKAPSIWQETNSSSGEDSQAHVPLADDDGSKSDAKPVDEDDLSEVMHAECDTAGMNHDSPTEYLTGGGGGNAVKKGDKDAEGPFNAVGRRSAQRVHCPCCSPAKKPKRRMSSMDRIHTTSPVPVPPKKVAVTKTPGSAVKKR